MKNISVAILFSLSSIAFIGGCVAPGEGFLNTNRPEDSGPEPITYEKTIQNYLLSALKDPHSVTDFSVSLPYKGSCSVGIFGDYYAWRVTTKFNAKNGLGGYAGLQTYYFWFHGENLEGVNQDAHSCPEAAGWQQSCESCNG